MKYVAAAAAGLLLVASTALAAVTLVQAPLSLVTSAQTATSLSAPVPLFSFALNQDAAETLSSVTVNVTSATAVAGDFASVAVYKDDGSGAFDGADLLAGSATTVNIGANTVITTAANNTLTGGKFFVTMATSATWGGTDSVTVTMPVGAIVTSANSPTTVAVTTSAISVPALSPVLSTAVAANTASVKSIALTFSFATNSPVINSANINTVLGLNHAHSWLDGNGGLGTATWNVGGTMLTINLTSAISAPTIAVGDTVTVAGTTLKDITATNNVTGAVVISGSFDAAATPALATAVAANTGSNVGLGAGDTVALNFNSATNKPVITASNIDTTLVLSSSHSWKDGAAAIGSANWSVDGKTLTITLTAGTSVPTVAVGDTVTVTGTLVKDSTGTNNATGGVVITGSFSTVSGGDNGDGDDDEGEGHACTNALINGRLYKLAGDTNTTVYLAAACRLKPFRGAAVFHARGHKFQNIISLSVLPTGAVSDQPALPAVGTLVKGSDSTVWFVTTGHKRKGFTSAAVFKALGFNFGQINQISDSDLNTMTLDSSVINSATQHPDGALIKCTNSPTIDQVTGTTLQAFTNADAFTLRGHTFQQVATVNCAIYHYVVGATIQQ